MARRVTSSQVRSQMRQAQSRRRAAVQRINREIQAYNNKVRHHNAERKRAIDEYNRQVRALNSGVRASQARINSTLSRLRGRRSALQHARIYQSAVRLSATYRILDRNEIDPAIADLAERETANSLSVASILLEGASDPYFAAQSLAETRVSGMLADFSPELSDRWTGAVFALDPRNPDASRHFCSSAREIIADIINAEALDEDVLAWFPDAELTPQGVPTRRQKLSYCLARGGKHDSALEGFGEANIKDVSALFKELNAGTHGQAGRFSLPQLTAIKTRVEDAIGFVCALVVE